MTTCAHCNQEFIHPIRPGRRTIYCSAECKRDAKQTYNHEYRERLRDTLNTRQRTRYANDAERRAARLEYSKAYYRENRERILRWHKQYNADPERRERKRQHYNARPEVRERHLSRAKEWQERKTRQAFARICAVWRNRMTDKQENG